MSPEQEAAHAIHWRERCTEALHRMRLMYTAIALLCFGMGFIAGYMYAVSKCAYTH